MMKQSKKKVALIFPQMIGAKNQIRRAQPPLGLCYIAGVLEQSGYDEILIIDAVVEGYDNVMPLESDPNLVKYGLSDETIIDKIRTFNPDIIGISALFSSQVECAFLISRYLKKVFPEVPIVFGGNHATNKYREIMEKEYTIDFILKGESDYTFTELLKIIFEREKYIQIPGLVWREGLQICRNEKNSLIKDMNTLPFPSWHILDMEKYFSIGMPHNPFVKSNRVGCIMTSRGCPEKCYFCSSSEYFGHMFRSMSSTRVKEMVLHMIDKFGIKELQIEDDSFTVNYKRVIEICEAIQDMNLRITLPNAIRADMPKDHEKRLKMFSAMRNAGVEQLGISVEHGDQEFLDKIIGKRLDLREVKITCELAHKVGLLVHANFMMGFPFETAFHREKTIEFARKLDADSYSVSLVTPLPGTPLWDIVEKNNLFMDGFNVNKALYVHISIKPHDISPEALYELVDNFNRELNELAQKRRPETTEKYKLFRGKTAEGDRKYHFINES